jgi:hypothetical protein
VKDATVSSVDLDKSKNFPTGKNPDYAAMRKLVQQAIHPATATPATTTPSTSATPSTKPVDATTPSTGPTENLANACAYHPTAP